MRCAGTYDVAPLMDRPPRLRPIRIGKSFRIQLEKASEEVSKLHSTGFARGYGCAVAPQLQSAAFS